MEVYFPSIWMIVVQCAYYCMSDPSKSSTFKLSDLPVLKRWEIPASFSKRKFDGSIGRRYKDISKEVKRSSYWELKPELNANEIDWYDDPIKVKLDFNYKNFIDGWEDGDDNDDKNDADTTGSNMNLMEQNKDIMLKQRASQRNMEKKTDLSIKEHTSKLQSRNLSVHKIENVSKLDKYNETSHKKEYTNKIQIRNRASHHLKRSHYSKHHRHRKRENKRKSHVNVSPALSRHGRKRRSVEDDHYVHPRHANRKALVRKLHRKRKLNGDPTFFHHLLDQSKNVAVNRNGGTTGSIETTNQTDSLGLSNNITKKHELSEKKKSRRPTRRGRRRRKAVRIMIKRALDQSNSEPTIQNLISKLKMHQMIIGNNRIYPSASFMMMQTQHAPLSRFSRSSFITSSPQNISSPAQNSINSKVYANLTPTPAIYSNFDLITRQSIHHPNINSTTSRSNTWNNQLDAIRKQNIHHPLINKTEIPQNIWADTLMNARRRSTYNVATNKTAPTPQSARKGTVETTNNHNNTIKNIVPKQKSGAGQKASFMMNELIKRHFDRIMAGGPLKDRTPVQQSGGVIKSFDDQRRHLMGHVSQNLGRITKATSEASRRLMNAMKDRAIWNKNIFRGKKQNISETLYEKKLDTAQMNKEKNPQNIDQRQHIVPHDIKRNSLHFNPKNVSQGQMSPLERQERITRSLYAFSNVASVENPLRTAKSRVNIQPNPVVDVERRSLQESSNSEQTQLYEKPHQTNDINRSARSEGFGNNIMKYNLNNLKLDKRTDLQFHHSQNYPRTWKKQNVLSTQQMSTPLKSKGYINIKDGIERQEIEVRPRTKPSGGRNQKLNKFLESQDEKKSHGSFGSRESTDENEHNIEHLHHMPHLPYLKSHVAELQEKLSKLSVKHPDVTKHNIEYVSPTSKSHKDIQSLHKGERNSEAKENIHHQTISKIPRSFVPSTSDGEGTKLKIEGGKGSFANIISNSFPKKNVAKSTLPVPHSEILEIAKLAIQHPGLLNKIERAAAALNKKSNIVQKGNENVEPSHQVGSQVHIKHFHVDDERAEKLDPIKERAEFTHTDGKPTGVSQAVKRGEIAHAESNQSINPEKIGMAVSLAMNQLKRDKMWGQVYVRVHPSGKIRVMVEETKQMSQNI